MITRPRLQSRLQPSLLLVALAAVAVATRAQATPILIDNFTTASSASVTNNTAFFNVSDPESGSFGGLNEITANVLGFVVGAQQASSKSASATAGGGAGTVSFSNVPGAATQGFLGISQFTYGGPAQNWTVGGNNTLRFTTGATSGDLSFVKALVQVNATEPTSAAFFWPSNHTFEIPFSAFSGVNFAAVTSLAVGITGSPSGIFPQQNFTTSASFTRIEVVPEPGAIAMLAAGGVALAGGLIRRRLAAKA
jgi:hypothetical protein